MKVASIFKLKTIWSSSFLLLAALLFSPAFLSLTAQAQQPSQPSQLSLGDILIALRSKKVTLPERNKILADAVKSRGITFSLTPEIEKELGGGGADPMLVAAIKEKTPAPKISAIEKKAEPVPEATPPPPDFKFYQKRGDDAAAKGDLDGSIADYTKAIEMKPSESWTYLSRGMSFFNKKNYDLSTADFSKAIELNPNNAIAYMNRGNSYERSGDLEKAVEDYKKAVALDPNNASVKTNLERLQNDLTAKMAPPSAPQKETAASSKPALSESAKPNVTPSNLPANVGSLKNYAVKLAVPVYSSMDRQRNTQGIVTVQITLDEEGKVQSVKALTGPPTLRQSAEDAARQSKFKPVSVAGKIIKATGFINYNFGGQ